MERCMRFMLVAIERMGFYERYLQGWEEHDMTLEKVRCGLKPEHE
jgi:hypothetical protein